MCDLDKIKEAAESARKNSQRTIAASAALNAAKQAAEKRANVALLVLRDACFQRSNITARKEAITIAVALAAGRAGASASCEDKALKLVMNMMYPRSEIIADCVVNAAMSELTKISGFAQRSYKTIKKAYNQKNIKEGIANKQFPRYSPDSEEEKIVMDKCQKVVILMMAIVIRRPQLIKNLFEISSIDKADALSKTVKQNMTKLARAVGVKHGASEIALSVAEATNSNENSLLLAFLDALASVSENNKVTDGFIETCYKIQEIKKVGEGKSPQFLVPVIFALNRVKIVSLLPDIVRADVEIFNEAISKMSSRLGRQALLFREEPNEETPTLKGMTNCEQLVFLHRLDFEAAGIRQKDYLDVIKICLDNESIFTDQVVLSALDHMSGVFLAGKESLPLAFMRTCILVCSKHESLHAWICNTLLPRLVEGKLYEETRLWEGWMRCANMLEDHADTSAAIEKLPPEQLSIYNTRYGR